MRQPLSPSIPSFPYNDPANPTARHLHESLWSTIFKDLLRDEPAYKEAFDRFELLAAIADRQESNGEEFRWVPTDYYGISQGTSKVYKRLLTEAFQESRAGWQAALPKNAVKTDIEKLRQDVLHLI